MLRRCGPLRSALGTGHGPNIRKVPMDRGLQRQLAQLPSMTSIKTPGNRPIAFASAAPEPVSTVAAMNAVVYVDGEGADPELSGVDNRPVAVLDMRRAGIPACLMDKLERRGVTTLTPLQAKLLQNAYALQDVAVSGPTGSGKTFGLSVAIIARLLRQGPMAPLSTLVLTPSVLLARQIEGWLHELWRFSDDPRLVLCATESMSHAQLRQALRTRRTANDYVSAPYVLVTTPEILWPVYTEIREAKVQSVFRKTSERRLKILPTVESVFVDEVDSVLPPGKKHAPGNQLLRDLTTRNHFEAPLQIVMASATLTPTTASHCRQFMRSAMFAQQNATIFDDAAMAATQRARVSSSKDVSKEASQPTASRRLLCAASVSHRFYVATTFAEQADCMSHALMQWAADNEEGGGGEGDAESEVPSALRSVRAVIVVAPNADVDLLKSRLLDAVRPLPLRVVTTVTPSTRTVRFTSQGDNESGDGGPEAVLIPSDLVRGMDVVGATHVFILTPPKAAVDYVHWSGRVGRMGSAGTAVTLLRKHEVRPVSDMCEALQVPFKIQRRQYEAIDTRALRVEEGDT